MFRHAFAQFTALVLAAAIAPVTTAAQQRTPAIRAGGTPKLSGSLGGAALPIDTTRSQVALSASFGEISPINPNPVVTLTIPIVVSTEHPCRVLMTVTALGTPVDGGLGLSDIGFSVRNIRSVAPRILARPEPLATPQSTDLTRLVRRRARQRVEGHWSREKLSKRPARAGRRERAASAAPKPGAALAWSPFDRDARSGTTWSKTGRATFASPLSTMGAETVIFVDAGSPGRAVAREWAFDVVLEVVPQFYSPSNFSLVINFAVVPDPHATDTWR